jgi:voltage-gated potassium channel
MWRQAENGRVIHSFEPLMLVLALLVVPVVLVEESHSPQAVKAAAGAANWVIWLGFATELVLVLWVAPQRRAALRAYWLEVLIVLLTPPFLPRLFSYLRAARLMRLLRLVRLGVFGGRALRAERLLTSREGFRYIALTTLLLVVLGGAAVSLVDTSDFPNFWLGIWWALVTVTTVGYGDIVPHTVAGRLVGGALMMIGIGFVAALTATVASSFISRDIEVEDQAGATEHEQIMAALRAIEKRLAALEPR